MNSALPPEMQKLTEPSDDSGKIIGKTRFRRLLYLIYAVILINFSFLMWFDTGYLNVPILIAIWILLGLSCLMLVYSAYNGEDMKLAKLIPVLSFIIALYIFLNVFINVIPEYGTDEIAIDTYAAYLILHGRNPYVDANMLNVFAFTKLPQNLITPLLNGGSVEYFSYPALSALLFVPAIAFGLPAYVILLAFNFAFFILLYFYYRKNSLSEIVPFLIVAMILDVEYSVLSVLGVTDIVWVFFLSASFIFRKDWRLSGAMYGLSIAFKQIPVVILPFFIYYLRKQEGYTTKKMVQFLLMAFLVFVIPNLPYMVMGPSNWFWNIVLAEFQPIIGVGIGPSVLSFAGFIYVPSSVFGIFLITVLLLFLYLYIVQFNRLKFAFFGFPVVIFLLNFRTLENYVIYWPFLVLLVLPEVIKRTPAVEPDLPTKKRSLWLNKSIETFSKNRKLVNFLVVGLVIVGAVASAGYVYTRSPEQKAPFQVMNITSYGNPYEIPNKVTSLTLMIHYTPPNGFPVSYNLFYRVFANSPLTTVNSLLWSGSEPVTPGFSNITIYPNTANDVLPYNVTFKVDAYHGNMNSFFSSRAITSETPVYFSNPRMAYPTYSKSEPYLGWHTQSNGTTVNTNYSYTSVGTYMSLNVGSQQGNWSSYSMQSSYNFSYLSANDFILSYSINGPLTNVSTMVSCTTLNFNGTAKTRISLEEFVGTQLSFESGTEQLWLGYNKSVTGSSIYVVNRSLIYMVTNSTSVDFSMVKEIADQYNWSFDDATFAYTIGTLLGKGSYHVCFYNSDIYSV